MSFWIKFFKDSGIPVGDAANYAVTFTDNRITRSMLMDLNKEYLNDMGIAILGDVIAILKHAKLVYTQDVKDKAIRDTSRPIGRASTPTQVTVPIKPSTPASRTLGHYIGTDRSSSPTMPLPSTKISKQLSARLGSSTQVAKSSPTVIRLGTSKPREEVPVPKSRRVFPEQEGRYKVSMPAGTTEKTRSILDQQRQKAEQQRIKAEAEKQQKVTSVFARLGIEKPHAAGDGVKKREPTITITGLGDINAVSSSSLTSTSVFTRLGGKATVKRAATSTVVCDDDDYSDVDRGSALEYAGIFKSPEKKAKLEAAKKIKKTAQKRLTIRAPVVSTSDMLPATEGFLSSDAGKSRKDIKSRLGRKLNDEVTSTTPKVLTQKPSTVIKTTKQVSTGVVSRRLGASVADMSIKVQVTRPAAKSSKGVFGRLGRPADS